MHEKNERIHCSDCPLFNSVYRHQNVNLKDLEHQLDNLRSMLFGLMSEVERCQKSLSELHEFNTESYKCIVNSSGMALNQQQEDAVYLILRKMATKAIDSHDGNRIRFLLELMIDENYDEDAVSIIVHDLQRALRSYPVTSNTRIEHNLPYDPGVVVAEVRHMFSDEVAAQKFVADIEGVKPTAITAKVSSLANFGIINPKYCYQDLWEVLHRHKIYPRSKNNWNAQINIKKK